MTLPAEVARAITGVFGLNNHRVMHRLPRPRQKVDAAASFAKTRPWFIPTELAGIYNFPDADARSQCIGLLEFGGGVEQSDVTAYFQQIGLPTPNVQIVAVDGVSTDPTADPDSTGEVMLDVDIAGALAGGAKVAVYFSTFDEKGLVDILSTVINDQTNDPSVLSVSWGWDENQPFNNGILWSAAAIEHVNHSLLGCGASRHHRLRLDRRRRLRVADPGRSRPRQLPGNEPLCARRRRHYLARAQGNKRADGGHRGRVERRPRKRRRRRRQRHHPDTELAGR